MVLRRKPVIWTLAVVAVVLLVFGVTLGVSSTRGFCTSNCHNVLADAVQANTHSPHAQTNCGACHLPSPTDPIAYIAHKAEGLGEVISELRGSYSLPLNQDDAVAFGMPSDRCTGCHNQPLNTYVAKAPGHRINHQRHADRGVPCAICHNRTAHPEGDFKLSLLDPKLKAQDWKHPNFMQMTACFRCHTQESVKGAPTGNCMSCHTPGFPLEPRSHGADDWAAKGHAAAASREESTAPWLTAALAVPPPKTEVTTLGVTRWSIGNLSSLRKVSQINPCSTCHAKHFCNDCHGLQMPHPSGFDKAHGVLSTKLGQDVCQQCHTSGLTFCSDCHHGTKLGIAPSGSRWKAAHPGIAKRLGKTKCVQLDGCHSPAFCPQCHANGGTLPKDAPAW